MSEALLGSDAKSEGTSSAFDLAANLITSGLGIGIFSLPWSAAGASIIPGALVSALLMATMCWTSCLVVEAGEERRRFDLGALLGILPGRLGAPMELLCNVTIWISGILVLPGYLMVVADTLQPFVAGTAFDSRALIICATGAGCLPLCFLDQRYLAFTSQLAIIVNVYLVVYVSYLALTGPGGSPDKVGVQPVCTIGLGRGLISMTSTIAMALVVQEFCLPLYETLERRSVARFRTVASASFGFIFFLFVGFQTAALYAFGTSISQDVLAALPETLAGDVARLGMVPLVLGVFPLNVVPMLAPVLHASWGGPRVGAVVTFAIVVISVILALLITDLGVLNDVNGAITFVVIDALGPALIGLYHLQKSPAAMAALIIGGTVVTVAGLVFTDNYVEDLKHMCYWR